MKAAGVILALAGALALQTTLAGLTIGGATAVNLVLVAVVYVALVPADRHVLHSTGDARGARWFEVDRLPALAFDHRKLLDAALDRLRRRIGETSMAFELLPAEFTLSELQSLCEVILGRPLDRRNFRRKVTEAGFITAARGKREGRHRPAQLFRFVPKAFERHAQDQGELPF